MFLHEVAIVDFTIDHKPRVILAVVFPELIDTNNFLYTIFGHFHGICLVTRRYLFVFLTQSLAPVSIR